METDYDELPLVYACSGCSSAAQMANDLAVKLDREGEAEMSCIAGVGGDVAPLVSTATAGRPILTIDGCPLACARQCLDHHDVEPDRYVQLAKRDVSKEFHADYDEEKAEELFGELRSVASELRGEA